MKRTFKLYLMDGRSEEEIRTFDGVKIEVREGKRKAGEIEVCARRSDGRVAVYGSKAVAIRPTASNSFDIDFADL